MGVAIDRVVADVVTGRCEVRGTHPFVGPAAGTEPLDSGFDFSLLPGGETSIARNDHYAMVCDLRLPAPEPRRAATANKARARSALEAVRLLPGRA